MTGLFLDLTRVGVEARWRGAGRPPNDSGEVSPPNGLSRRCCCHACVASAEAVQCFGGEESCWRYPGPGAGVNDERTGLGAAAEGRRGGRNAQKGVDSRDAELRAVTI
jgi:hypothetical protein